MESEIGKLQVLRVAEEGISEVEDVVVREFSFTIVLNGQELVTLLCSHGDLRYLVVGFLLSQGFIENKKDIKKLEVDDDEGIAQVEIDKKENISFRPVIASSGARSAAAMSARKVTAGSRVKLTPSNIFTLVDSFVQCSKLFKNTGGVHSAALCNYEGIQVFSEDIGRHNAIDKIFGECLLGDIQIENNFILTSGRVSSEIVLKVAKRNIPVLISKSAPTDKGVELAADLNMTLVGFVRGKRMNIYTNSWRIIRDGK